MKDETQEIQIDKLAKMASVPEKHRHAVMGACLVEACEILKRIEKKLDRIMAWERYEG